MNTSYLVKKIIMIKEIYIEDIKKNKDVIVKEKENDYEHNAKELDKKTIEKSTLEENNKKLYESVTDQINVESKDVKLKDLRRSTLNEKEKEKIRMIKFLSENDDCPV